MQVECRGQALGQLDNIEPVVPQHQHIPRNCNKKSMISHFILSFHFSFSFLNNFNDVFLYKIFDIYVPRYSNYSNKPTMVHFRFYKTDNLYISFFNSKSRWQLLWHYLQMTLK